jgi:ABC-type lipoprotein export system ATPase subunit
MAPVSATAVELQQVFCVHRSAEGDAAALQGLTMSVPAGEIVCVIGPSGAGKSTLLRVLAGIETPSAGDVRVFGREFGRLPARLRARIRREKIGFVGQNWSSILSPELPLRDAVSLPLIVRGAARRDARARATALLEASGLGGREGAFAADLSGGERQQAAVCAALVHRPALLLADEPTGELDRASASTVRELIRELARADGATVVIVSHDAATAGRADRSLRIRDGRIEAELGGGEEAQLVDPRGWVRLPPELLGSAVIGDRVRVRRAPGGTGLLLTGAGGREVSAQEPSAAPEAEPGTGGRDVSWSPAHVTLRTVLREYREGANSRVVLGGFSASFSPGRLTVVRGRSGAGKSTLLRLVAGLETPDAGEVLVDGTGYAAADGEALAALRRERVGYLPQDPWPVGFLSAQENVVLALRLRGESPAGAGARAAAALASVGLEERARQRVSRLSAGEAQRVGLARALACALGMLVLDEPTSRLDERAAGQMAELLTTEARERAHTIICASHDEQLIGRADSVVSLSG